MSEYDNTNSGAMFQAKNKRTEKSPDRTGEACIECPDCGAKNDFWLSGWLNKMKSSSKTYLSIKFNVKEDQPTTTSDDLEDDIPFNLAVA